jgi:light-harvesting protein B-800-850 alpha chain
VNPSIGLPLFLGAVAAIALLVHFAVLSHTTWFGGYWQGKAKATTSMVVPAAPQAGFVIPA